MNQTPIDWFCKRQSQVETATHGSEFMVARQATERIIDLRYTLRSFGVPLDGPAWLFGDNKSVVTSSTIPHSNLSKRWNALSYHRVREAVAGGWLRFEHIPGTQNPADVFTKALPWHVMGSHVEPLLMWKGETVQTPGDGTHPEGSITETSPGSIPNPHGLDNVIGFDPTNQDCGTMSGAGASQGTHYAGDKVDQSLPSAPSLLP